LEENNWAASIHLALLVAVVIAFWKVVSSFWSRGSIQSWGRPLERSHDPDLDQKENINRERSERPLIKSRLEGITRKGIKEGREIIEDLKEMVKIVDKYGDTDRGRHLIAEKIKELAPRENLILNRLASLKEISERIENFDLKAFKELGARWDKVPEKERNIVKEEILIEKDKILSEEKLRELESELARYDKDLRYGLNMAVASLRSNQPSQARDWLTKAIKAEEEAINIFEEMKRLEDRLLKLTRMELRTFKKEVKDDK
jgi:hypothetical protein